MASSSNAALGALGHAISGSIGTAISTASLYPLDLVTTRLKAQQLEQSSRHYNGVADAVRHIIHSEGFTALYSGLGPDVAKSVVDSFLFFGIYNYLRRHSNRSPKVLQELAMGALAGASARFLTTPISNVVTRKQMMAGDDSLGHMLRGIVREGGLLSLWSGYSATLVLTLNPSITFFVNRRLADRIIPALEEEDVPVAWVAFFLAAFSKATATALTFPFQTGKTRLQMASKVEEKSASSQTGSEKNRKTQKDNPKSFVQRILNLLDRTIWGVIVRIIHNEGVRALYAGVSGELLKSFFSHGLTMLTKGLIHRMVIRTWRVLEPELRKRRLQAK